MPKLPKLLTLARLDLRLCREKECPDEREDMGLGVIGDGGGKDV
jgi:hypothetical protein